MNWKRTLLVLSISIFTVSTAAWSQPRPDKNWKSWFGHFKGGYTIPQGDAGDVLDDGFSLGGGATYWPEEWPIGLVLDVEYSEFDIARSALDEINRQIIEAGGEGEITGGDVASWSFTVNGTWSPSREGSGFYLIAGAGAYYVEGRITEDALVWYPPICDPWFWWCIPGGVGPGTVIRGSTSSTEFGWNAGAGWAFEVGSASSQLYIEARYHSALTDPENTTYLPLTIGYRW